MCPATARHKIPPTTSASESHNAFLKKTAGIAGVKLPNALARIFTAIKDQQTELADIRKGVNRGWRRRMQDAKQAPSRKRPRARDSDADNKRAKHPLAEPQLTLPLTSRGATAGHAIVLQCLAFMSHTRCEIKADHWLSGVLTEVRKAWSNTTSNSQARTLVTAAFSEMQKQLAAFSKKVSVTSALAEDITMRVGDLSVPDAAHCACIMIADALLAEGVAASGGAKSPCLGSST